MRPFLCGLLVLAPLCIAAQETNAVSSSPVPPCSHALPLTPEATAVAADIGITAQLDRLRAIACDSTPVSLLQQLILRQQITEAVVAAALDVDGAVGEIDYERAQIEERRIDLSNAKDRSVNLLSLANIVIGSGSGILTNAMQFSNSAAMAGDGVGVAGGAGGVLLSILGLRVKAGRAHLGIAPNMLAQLFGRPPEIHSVYPPDVWAYLNQKPLAYPRVASSWREQLVQDWQAEKRIGPPDAAASQKKIALLTSSISEHAPLPLNVLTERDLMLLDTGARIQ